MHPALPIGIMLIVALLLALIVIFVRVILGRGRE
jgi:hypothetical protein